MRGKTLIAATIIASVWLVSSCAPKKTEVKMKAFGDPHAAENRKTPEVILVSSLDADGTYHPGDSVEITVQFSKAVHLEGGSELMLALETGENDQSALYEAGSGTDTLRFVYLVADGDKSEDLQYTGTDALSAGPTTLLRDEFGHDADLTLPALDSPNSLAAGKNLIIGIAAVAGVDAQFERSWYQTRSTKRLLIKSELVADLAQISLTLNESPYSCSVTQGFTSPFFSSSAGAALDFLTPSGFDASLSSGPYGSPQPITIELNDHSFTQEITIKDFEIFGAVSSGFSGDKQMVGGFQGWISPVGAIHGEQGLIVGQQEMMNY